MVNTRSQTARKKSVRMSGLDRHSEAESEDSVPDILTRDQMNRFENGDLLNYRNYSERYAVNQRFSEMNKKISELTNLVLALMEKISSSNREGNGLNTVSNDHETRSDNISLLSSAFIKVLERIIKIWRRIHFLHVS